MMKNLLPKTASQRAIAGLTSLALVAGGLTVMPYAGAQDEPNPAAPVVAEAAPGTEAETNGLPENLVDADVLANAVDTAATPNAPQQTSPLPIGDAKGSFSDTAAAGSKVDFHAIDLPVGGRVISLGAGGVNWLTKEQIYDAVVGNGGEIDIKDVQIPADAKTGDQIYFTYLDTLNEEYEVQVDAKVTSGTETINVDQYTRKLIQLLGK